MRVSRVSILARAEARALRNPNLRPDRIRPCFNPRPRRGAGATTRRCFCSWTLRRFNPRPRRGAGATSARLRRFHREIVSILARAEARALPPPRPRARAPPSVSILARAEARALRMTRKFTTGSRKFQSSPAPRRGRYRQPKSHSDHRWRFNPRPRRGAGATAASARAGHHLGVSILARAEARALPPGFLSFAASINVSILARAEARALHQQQQQRAPYQEVSILARAEARALR